MKFGKPRILLAAAGCLLALFPYGAPLSPAKAQSLWDKQIAMNEVEPSFPSEIKDPREYAVQVILVFFTFLGLITISFIMYGGYLWMTAGGDSAKVDRAKAMIKNACIGLVVILASYVILNFVINIFYVSIYGDDYVP